MADEGLTSGSRVSQLSLTSLRKLDTSQAVTLFDQTASSWVLQAQHMDRMILGFEVLPAQIQAAKPLPVGRSRYNCTRASRWPGRYYWYSYAWIRRDTDGNWSHE